MLEATGASRRRSNCAALSRSAQSMALKGRGAGMAFAPPEGALTGSEDGSWAAQIRNVCTPHRGSSGARGRGGREGLPVSTARALRRWAGPSEEVGGAPRRWAGPSEPFHVVEAVSYGVSEQRSVFVKSSGYS